MQQPAATPATDDGAPAPRQSGALTLEFSETRVPVRFIDAAEVAEQMRRALHEWAVFPGEDRGEAPVTVRRLPYGYRVESVWLDEPVDGLTAVAAACCALIDVLESLLDADRSLLCLHCAAAEIAGRLVVLTGPSHAGKSTLASRLSAEDLVLYCDDMLPLDRKGRGVAVGLGPRLRLPLPARATIAFREHVARHLGPADDRYGFLNAPTVAGFGRRAPIGAIVLLERLAEGPARFRRAEPAEALGFLIEQNLAADRRPDDVLERLRRLAASVPCVRLEYSDLEDATQLITRTFAQWPPRGLKALPSRPAAAPQPPLAAPVPPADPARRYRRRRDVAVRRFGGELFLSQAEEQRILRLNAVGGAVWRLLETPLTPGDVVECLAIAFPDVPPATIEADVLRLIGDMLAFALVQTEAETPLAGEVSVGDLAGA